MRLYSIEPRHENMLKDIDFQSLDTGLDCLKTASKKAGEFLKNKIVDAVTKSHDDEIMKTDENPRNVEQLLIPLEKREEILSKLRKLL